MKEQEERGKVLYSNRTESQLKIEKVKSSCTHALVIMHLNTNQERWSKQLNNKGNTSKLEFG